MSSSSCRLCPFKNVRHLRRVYICVSAILPVLPLLRLRIAAGRVARESRAWPAVSPHRHSGGRPVHRAERGTIKALDLLRILPFLCSQSIGVFTLFGCAANKTGAPRKEKNFRHFSASSFLELINVRSAYLIHMIFVRGILKHTKLHPYGAGSPFCFDRPDPRHLLCLVHP